MKNFALLYPKNAGIHEQYPEVDHNNFIIPYSTLQGTALGWWYFEHCGKINIRCLILVIYSRSHQSNSPNYKCMFYCHFIYIWEIVKTTFMSCLVQPDALLPRPKRQKCIELYTVYIVAVVLITPLISRERTFLWTGKYKAP